LSFSFFKNNVLLYKTSTFVDPLLAEKIKKRKAQEKKLKAVLRDIRIYCLFIWVIYNILLHLHLHLLFKIQKVKNIWSWLSDVFLPAMKSQTWYNNENRDLKQYISDYLSLITGDVYIRQFRIKKR
jgi:hypothetical protein